MATGKNLKKVARGGAVFLFGKVGGIVLQFLGVVIVIRLLEKSEYGLITLSWLLVQITATIGILGLNNGLPRFLSKYSEKSDKKKIGCFAGSILFLTSCFSLLLAALFFWSADFFSHLLSDPALAEVLRIFSLALPPLVIMHTFTAIFRGTEEVLPKVIFEDILSNLTRILIIIGILVLYLGFQAIVWGYVFSLYITMSLYAFYAFKKWMGVLPLDVDGNAAKEIVVFSLPLLGAAIMSSTADWAGPLILGYLSSSEAVAIFNAPLRLAKVVAFPLLAMAFLYMPLATKLFAHGNTSNLRELYANTTKWSFLITAPFIIYCILDAEFLVTFLFGETYIDSANVLRILVISFSVHTFFGPNGMTLIAAGYSRPIFYGQIIVALLSVSLCLLLVPDYSALGAALALAVARISSNLYISIFLYLKTRLHPFAKHYVKPVLFTILIGFLSFFFLQTINLSNAFLHLLFFLLLIFSALISPFVTRSVNDEDFELIKSIERRLSKNSRVTDWISLRIGVSKK